MKPDLSAAPWHLSTSRLIEDVKHLKKCWDLFYNSRTHPGVLSIPRVWRVSLTWTKHNLNIPQHLIARFKASSFEPDTVSTNPFYKVITQYFSSSCLRFIRLLLFGLQRRLKRFKLRLDSLTLFDICQLHLRIEWGKHGEIHRGFIVLVKFWLNATNPWLKQTFSFSEVALSTSTGAQGGRDADTSSETSWKSLSLLQCCSLLIYR